MANCVGFHTQIASIMEVLANAAVAEICKLVDDDYAVFRLEITQSQKENRGLRRKLQLQELKVARERAERTIRERVLASRPSSVKMLDGYRGMARGDGHLTGGHRSFLKPAGHNTWKDEQPITVDEGSGTSTQHIIVIESVDTEAAGPEGSSLVKQEKTEGEEDQQHSRDIQTGAAVATEDPTNAPAQPRTRRSIMEVSGTLNSVLNSETDTKTLTVTHRLLHTGSDHRSDPKRLGLWKLGSPPAPGSDYVPVFHQNERTVHSREDGDGDALHTGGDDPSCSYATEMDPGNMPLGLETQTDLSRGDWNQYSSSIYSEGCQDKKVEGLVVEEVTVKVEGDISPTWNADSHLGDGHSQGRYFLDYRESLEKNPNVTTHSPSYAFGDRDPVSTSMGPSDSHSRILLDQVLHSNDSARAQARGGGETSDNSKEKRFLCMFCNKGFSSPQSVEIHQRVHRGVKPFNCTQCHMRFSQSSDLKRHQRVHRGVKPFSCTQCLMRFTQSSDLKRHQRVHTGEKPFSCPQCDMRFTQAGSLKRHLKVHTGERPFACPHCGKRFSERRYLRIHQQKNHSTL
ncbi:zinc finger and SCAN domain-containing protein 12-like isoform X2 [Oncorhynchus tshawytscha]|uniref:C2H2-type domain-containing protein n=1 Tax=Oncorhynchus tshawytscha TaxID=74940 RepID=A0AAZ3SHW1_ONCTS|nr:zinc finger and SCAN domain-containing protein 12-like isoform X2 [Oncorhynchus tshawytscha]